MVLAGAALSSCSVTRRIPEGSYLLKRNTVEVDRQAPRRERISSTELARSIRQSPNRHFLGTNLYPWLYAQADPSKNNGWNRFLRRTGEVPVVWEPEKTRQSLEFIESHLASRGFFSGTATATVDTVRGKKVKVHYRVRQGAPSYISSVSHTFRDTLLRREVMADSAATLLHAGDRFDVGVMKAEQQRITTALKNRGYYDFNVGDISYIADTTGGGRTVALEMVVGRHLDGYGEDGASVYNNHRRYTVGEIYVHSNYDPLGARDALFDTLSARGINIIYSGKMNVRPRVLRRAIRLAGGSLYSAADVATTSSELMRLGAFRSISVIFDPAGRPTDSLGVLNCDIRCVPGLRQSLGFDLEGSTTSSFYGLRGTLGYQNRNAFRGAELFDASLTAGFEFLKGSDRKLSYELGTSVSLSFPRFVFWIVERNEKLKNPLSTLTLSANWQDRVYYSRALFGLKWGYSWGIRRFENLTLRPFDVSLVRLLHMNTVFSEQLNNPYLAASYADQLIAGISVSYVYNNQPRDLDAGAMVLRVNAETTGNTLSGLVRIFGKPVAEGHYTALGIRFSQYARGEVSFSQKIVLGEKTSFAYRLQGGAIYSYGNSSSPPFDKLFFAGGVNSMRGWAVRTLGPGTQIYEKKSYPAQMGDVKFEVNAELRFPMFKQVNGALFFDVGNIWFMRSRSAEYHEEAVFRLKSFYRQLGFNTGVGVRLDLRFVVLRLDWGIQLHSPNRPAGQRWIYDFRWRNTALSFGVGYPF